MRERSGRDGPGRDRVCRETRSRMGRTSENGLRGEEERSDAAAVFLLRHNGVRVSDVRKWIDRGVDEEGGRRQVMVGSESEPALASVALLSTNVKPGNHSETSNDDEGDSCREDCD